MELKQAIADRRSVRSYTDRALAREEIDELLRAAVSAPSACNMQSWHFYVLADAKEREKLHDICADWIAKAPVVFIVCTDKNAIEARFGERARKFPIQDTALAMENMLLRAVDMGLGGCVIGAYKQDECARVFGIPDEHEIVALLPIGEPTETIPARERRPMSEVVTFIGDVPDGAETTEADEKKPYELRCAVLPGAVFDDLNLADVTFNNIWMAGGRFNDINMEGVSFSDINMKNTSFGGLTLEGAHFGCVEMCRAKFENVDFTEAEFKNCKFDGVVHIDDK